ncbi:MAG: aminopeptidase, partial [Dethiosulfovibrio peptidovorans]
MIDIKIFKDSANQWKGDALVLLLREEDCGGEATLPCGDLVKELVSRKDFTGKKGVLLQVPLFGGAVRNLYLAGLGKEKECGSALVRDMLAYALRTVGRQHNGTALVPCAHLRGGKLAFDEGGLSCSSLMAEAVELCGYVFDKYKQKEDDEKDFSLREVFVTELSEEDAAEGRKFAAAQIMTRELANEPGNVINPPVLAGRAEALAEASGLDCEIWNEKRLEKERMGALLAVGRGSATPPRLIRLSYVPKRAKKKVVFVGKGLTFDSGGLDIKPADFMTTMKGDKSGGCNVLGIMQGVAALAPEVEVHGIVAAAENMPSGTAYRPDDIVRARNGKTIEINNTDAEGRLALADALSLASEMRPDAIIDMATLTGACVVALGKWTGGLFSRDDSLA